MAGRNVALGDRDEARQPRLGGEEIVATRVEGALGDEIADREQLAVVVEQKAVTPFRAPSPARSSSRDERRAARAVAASGD